MNGYQREAFLSDRLRQLLEQQKIGEKLLEKKTAPGARGRPGRFRRHFEIRERPRPPGIYGAAGEIADDGSRGTPHQQGDGSCFLPF